MDTELHCPECGHHIGSLKQSKTKERKNLSSPYMQSELGLTSRYLTDCTEPDPSSKVRSADMVAHYYAFLGRMTRDSDVSRQAFGTALRELGVQHYRSNGVRYYKGMKLR